MDIRLFEAGTRKQLRVPATKILSYVDAGDYRKVFYLNKRGHIHCYYVDNDMKSIAGKIDRIRKRLSKDRDE